MKQAKKIIAVFILICISIAAVGCNVSDITLPENTDAPSVEQLLSDMQAAASSIEPSDFSPVDYGEVKINKDFDFDSISNYVMINVKDYGSILIELRPDVAPVTVNNFKKLVLEGFYNGLTFHRVVENLMIEGGELDEKNVIHDSEMIYGEFADNNFTNNLNHVKGVISMSRKNIPDSASNGFFIVLDDAPQLDSRYAAFGYVIFGFDVLEKLETAELGANNAPVTPIIIEKIQFMDTVNK